MRRTPGSFSATTPTSDTFTVDETAGTVTHHIQGSLFPEDLGKDFVRRFRVDGDTFELSFTSRSGDGSESTRTLAFRRSR